jgi:hypothetical protein
MLGLVEMNSLLKKEEITPKFGGSTDMLLFHGQSFFSLKNGPGYAVPFQFGNWSRSSNHFHNENGSIDC